MPSKVIVLTAEDGGTKQGEITVVEDRGNAERFIETLLAEGLQEERIRVFNASEVNMQITYRPVVAFVGKGHAGAEAQDYVSASQGEAQPVAPEAKPEQSPRKKASPFRKH